MVEGARTDPLSNTSPPTTSRSWSPLPFSNNESSRCQPYIQPLFFPACPALCSSSSTQPPHTRRPVDPSQSHGFFSAVKEEWRS